MSKTGQTSTRRPNLDMCIALAGFIAGVLANLSFENVQHLLGHKDVFRKKLITVFEISLDIYADIRAEWEKFYLDHWRLAVDFSDVHIPEKPVEGSWQLIFVAQGLTLNATLAVMRKVFSKVSTNVEDLDGNVPTNTRTSTRSYAVWVLDGVEPDEKYLGKSTRDADMEGSIGITFLERLVSGVKLFVEKKQHLDVKGVTLCTSSRSLYGCVPSVYWVPGDGAVCVRTDWYSVDDSYPARGLRQAVS